MYCDPCEQNLRSLLRLSREWYSTKGWNLSRHVCFHYNNHHQHSSKTTGPLIVTKKNLFDKDLSGGLISCPHSRKQRLNYRAKNHSEFETFGLTRGASLPDQHPCFLVFITIQTKVTACKIIKSSHLSICTECFYHTHTHTYKNVETNVYCFHWASCSRFCTFTCNCCRWRCRSDVSRHNNCFFLHLAKNVHEVFSPLPSDQQGQGKHIFSPMTFLSQINSVRGPIHGCYVPAVTSSLTDQCGYWMCHTAFSLFVIVDPPFWNKQSHVWSSWWHVFICISDG